MKKTVLPLLTAIVALSSAGLAQGPPDPKVLIAAQREGMAIALEAGATLAAYHMLLDTKFLTPEDETVLFFTGSGLSEIGTYV